METRSWKTAWEGTVWKGVLGFAPLSTPSRIQHLSCPMPHSAPPSLFAPFPYPRTGQASSLSSASMPSLPGLHQSALLPLHAPTPWLEVDPGGGSRMSLGPAVEGAPIRETSGPPASGGAAPTGHVPPASRPLHLHARVREPRRLWILRAAAWGFSSARSSAFTHWLSVSIPLPVPVLFIKQRQNRTRSPTSPHAHWLIQ
mmetsp:Transcript_129492/g.223755  ORF Transcript_129492/g.223755 Transcript_129492/m.223755 type:complete len:200 (+) Transcript_129492:1136-1735(+)